MSAARRGRKRANATGRSTTSPKFVQLFGYVIESKAYRSLGSHARSALIEMYFRFNGTNNGSIIFGERELADRMGVAKNTASKALEELQEKGFVRINQAGSFHVKDRRLATTWILTEKGCGGKYPTKDFMEWKPDAQTAGQNSERGRKI